MSSTFKTLCDNFLKHLDGAGIDTTDAACYFSDLNAVAMLLRMKIKPIVHDVAALETLIGAELIQNISDADKKKSQLFLQALCELV